MVVANICNSLALPNLSPPHNQTPQTNTSLDPCNQHPNLSHCAANDHLILPVWQGPSLVTARDPVSQGLDVCSRSGCVVTTFSATTLLSYRAHILLSSDGLRVWWENIYKIFQYQKLRLKNWQLQSKVGTVKTVQYKWARYQCRRQGGFFTPIQSITDMVDGTNSPQYTSLTRWHSTSLTFTSLTS